MEEILIKLAFAAGLAALIAWSWRVDVVGSARHVVRRLERRELVRPSREGHAATAMRVTRKHQ